MLKKTFFLVLLVLSLNSSAKALGPIDKFILNHCGNVCTEDNNECRVCYNEAVDLFDQVRQPYPNGNWNFSRGVLEFEF